VVEARVLTIRPVRCCFCRFFWFAFVGLVFFFFSVFLFCRAPVFSFFSFFFVTRTEFFAFIRSPLYGLS